MKTESIIAILLSLIVMYLTYVIMLPFLVPIFWAAAFVILFHPYYRWLLRRLHNRSIASLVACFSIALFLMVPMAIIGTLLAEEVVGLYHWAETYLQELSTRADTSPLLIFPYIQEYLERYVDVTAVDIQNMIANSIKQASGYLMEGVKGAIKNFAEFFFNLFLAFFSMFFIFKEGDRILEVVKDILPLSEGDKEDIFSKNRLVISATFSGGVLVGAVQGLLGGIAFWFLGLPNPILWGFVMFMLSFLPGIGTTLVWIPAAIYLLVIGSYTKLVILLLWGTLVVGLADNILRPIIVSGKTRQHPLLLFFSILGAVHAFGLIGIIAGPIILSLAEATLEIYRRAIKKKPSEA
ncbi:MAG TPA: AI-2E family transporter [Thermodesulfobacteriota bacterium]|nr:AI-2E family transporter [Thermodesulfobacteriota bacterium]